MALIVQKYGGSSVKNIERIKYSAQRVKQTLKQNNKVVVVVSAMEGETNRLLNLAKQAQENPSPRELDVIASTGEQVSIALFAMALQDIGVDAVSFTGWQANLKTDSVFTKARILSIDDRKIKKELDKGKVVVIAGFQGICDDGDITTLGRGGSDTSAVAVAAAIGADECQIYTDVDGVYTTDPRIEPKARRLDSISFEEMLELASLGSKVLQIRSVEFAGKYKVKLRVLSSYTKLEEENKGTLITYEGNEEVESEIIAGVACDQNQARIKIKGVVDKPGIAAKIISLVSCKNIEIDMIIQNVGQDNLTDFSFTIPKADIQQVIPQLEEIKKELNADSYSIDENVAKISLVGIGMRSHCGIAARMFSALAKENINIDLISTSEIKISVLIDQKYAELAVRELHNEFELDKDKKTGINV